VTSLRFFEFLVGATLLSLTSCNGVAAVPPLSPQSQQVRVEDRDPPAGATLLGPVQATHGQGCSFTGDQGTREGATALLKEAAVAQGANFVKVTKVTEPYSGHDCVHREFKMEGLSYRLAGTPIIAPASSTAPAPPVATTAATAAVAVAPPVAPGTPAAATAAVECTPPCSPGYACDAGVCKALCNPGCAPDQICRTDRVCVPATASH